MMKLFVRLMILLPLLLASCTLPSPSDAEPSTPVATKTPKLPTSTPQPEVDIPQAEHLIGVRQINGVGEFYDKQTDGKFILRGANYVFVPADNQTNLLLRVGVYDPQRTRDDFTTLAGLGYNTVRVFFDQCNQGPGCIGDDDNIGLNPEYLDNIADMMSAGRETGIYILFTSGMVSPDFFMLSIASGYCLRLN